MVLISYSVGSGSIHGYWLLNDYSFGIPRSLHNEVSDFKNLKTYKI
jgi:hypothetical protein